MFGKTGLIKLNVYLFPPSNSHNFFDCVQKPFENKIFVIILLSGENLALENCVLTKIDNEIFNFIPTSFNKFFRRNISREISNYTKMPYSDPSRKKNPPPIVSNPDEHFYAKKAMTFA